MAKGKSQTNQLLSKKPITDVQKDLERIKQLEEEAELRAGLPFLFGWKWYKWARDFYESTNKINLLCAANQISKSSTQIRKCINWATNQDLWPELWVNRPTQFWYLYPSQAQVNAEFKTKWVQFLPTGNYKKEGPYAWKEIKDGGDTIGIEFLTSGVYVFFKTYTQKAAVLQSSTVDSMFIDEEVPENLYEELMFRLSAANGYFNMVFTATLGQEFWRLAMEPGSSEKENLPNAFKQTISMYDCMKYEDGSNSHWTLEKIKIVEARCGTAAEVLKRVHGRFIVIGGRKYEAFDIKRHMKPSHPLPKDWLVYAGADPGSGGAEGHPASICFVAVKPDFRAGRVFAGWRGDGIQTTAGDVVEKYIAMKKELNLQGRVTAQYYDWSSRDFFEIASRMGENFQKAEKGHDIGENVINTLFKNDMMFIYEGDETVKLGGELATLLKNTPKNKAKDNFCFIAGTMIQTINGEVPIEEINIGDLVATRQGYRKINATMRRKAETIRRVICGRVITCTPDHPFWTENRGWLHASELTDLDIVINYTQCQNQKKSFLMESLLGVSQTLNNQHIGIIIGQAGIIVKTGLMHFIEKFISRSTEKFQWGTQYITKMATTLIIPLKIWNVYQEACTQNSIYWNESKTDMIGSPRSKRRGLLQKNGTDQSKVASGIVRCLKSLIKKENPKLSSVKFVKKNTKQETQERQPVFVVAHAKPGPIELANEQLVYNITVDEVHEYFANGVLVSNCDAFRYAVSKVPWDWSAITGEVFDRGDTPEQPMNAYQKEVAERRKMFDEDAGEEEQRLEDAFAEINEAYGE